MDFDEIYNALTGEVSVPGINDEFSPSGICGGLYDIVYCARERLGERLESDAEDSDIMEICTAYERIQRRLCLAVYRLTEQRAEAEEAASPLPSEAENGKL